MSAWIREAGLHLLDVLKIERAVDYSRFYNFEPGTDVKLAEAVWRHRKAATGEDPEDAEYEKNRLLEEAHLCIDWAAWQLYDRGLVRIAFLDGKKLEDEEPDFRIELTPMGEKFLAEGPTFGFRHLSSRFSGTAASEWVIWFLDGGGPGQHLTLNDVMEYGETDGDVEITDDSKNVYPLGTPIYAWAFEVALWHHAREGNVIGSPKDDAQKAVWAEFIGRKHLFPRPDMAEPHPLWDVPFRLAPGVRPDKVKHVGGFGGE